MENIGLLSLKKYIRNKRVMQFIIFNLLIKVGLIPFAESSRKLLVGWVFDRVMNTPLWCYIISLV